MTIHSTPTTPVINEHRLPLTTGLDTGLCPEREQDAAVVTMLNSNPPEGDGPNDMLGEFAEAVGVRAPAFTAVGIRTTISAKAFTAQTGAAIAGRRRPVPFGKYWRSRPFVFSFVPRCQGDWGSAKKTGMPVSILNWA